jgi:hypothetical protein
MPRIAFSESRTITACVLPSVSVLTNAIAGVLGKLIGSAGYPVKKETEQHEQYAIQGDWHEREKKAQVCHRRPPMIEVNAAAPPGGWRLLVKDMARMASDTPKPIARIWSLTRVCDENSDQCGDGIATDNRQG